MVASPVSDKDVQQGRLVGSPEQSSDDGSDTPPPPPVTTDIAGRRRVADFIRRAGTLLDPDPERYNNSDFTQGRYRTYPRTPGEDILNPKLAEQETKFYLARAGPSRSQIDLVTPGSPTGRDSNAGASGSGSQTPVGSSQTPAGGSQTPVGGSQTPSPDLRHHARTGSSGSQFLEVPQFFPPMLAVVASPEQLPSSKPSSV